MKIVVGGMLVLIAMIMILPQLHLQFNLLGADTDHRFWISVRDCLVASDR